MASNTSRKRNIDEVDAEPGPSKRVRLAQHDSLAINTRPSRSILPPERPGSVQSSLTFTSDTLNGTRSIYTVEEDQVTTQDAGQSRYSPLGPREFRLCRIHSGEENEIVHCSLVVDNLDNPSSYEALSYTWGSPVRTHEIQISNEDSTGTFTRSQAYHIGANLFGALRRLRMADRPLILWIDALCINQDDVHERNQQVSLMGEIYEKSHRTLVWLGEGTPSSDLALSNLHTAFQPGFFGRRPDNFSQFIHPLANVFASAFTDITSRNYWSRVWVVQEICLARSVTVIVGQRQICIQDLKTLLDLIRLPTSPATGDFNDAEHYSESVSGLETASWDRAVRILHIANRAVRTSGDGRLLDRSLRLDEMLPLTTSLSASDPRDKVFGLLALVRSNIGSTLLRPDYSKSVSEVFQDATRLMIDESGSLDMILRPWAPIAHGLPSWIPQLDRLPRNTGTSLMGLHPVYSASDKLVPDVQFGPVVRRTRRQDRIADPSMVRGFQPYETGQAMDSSAELGSCVLLAGGIELGSITDLSTRMADGLVSRDCLEMCGMSFTDGCEAVKLTSDAVWNKLWRTFVADRDANGERAPSRFGLAFFTVFKELLRLRSMDTAELLEEDRDSNVSEFLKRVRDVTLNRRMFRSSLNIFDENLLGFAPRAARQGDKIAILFGCSVPVILSPDATKGNGYMRIVGEAYVHGKMDGEAICGLDETAIDGSTQTFHIV